LRLKLKVKATGVSFLVACLTRCISSGRHAPFITIISQRSKKIQKPKKYVKKEMPVQGIILHWFFLYETSKLGIKKAKV
jgi:L-asparaginase II